jgi:hypothetical protein
MKDKKILFLEDIISQRVRKQAELDYYAKQLEDLEKKMFYLRKEIQLTNFIIDAIEQEKITDLKPLLESKDDQQ